MNKTNCTQCGRDTVNKCRICTSCFKGEEQIHLTQWWEEEDIVFKHDLENFLRRERGDVIPDGYQPLKLTG